MRLFPKAPLPLLAKELVEQAALRRTYIVRVVYAVLLFAIFLMITAREFRSMGSGYYAFQGRGKMMFEGLIVLQFLGIALFLPATMSGTLTYEKERQSMALLLLTNLRPRHILAQKYLGRLISMFSFLLLGLPLLAICYAFGGVTTEYLMAGIYVLVLTCLQVGALALMCSAFCRTSLNSFISSYLLLALLYIGFPLVYVFVLGGHHRVDERVAFALVPAPHFFDDFRRGASGGSLFVNTIPILVSIVVFLLMARKFVVSRAFLEPKNRLMDALRWLDRFFEAANKAVGGFRFFRERDSLPGDKPIAWREVTRRSLGRATYLVRLLLLIEIPILFVCAASLMNDSWGRNSGSELLSGMFYIVAILVALTVATSSVNAIASERTNQTLEVLLTTPIAGRDIVKQKMRGVRRLLLVLMIPLVTILGVGLWWAETVPGFNHRDVGLPTLGLTVALLLVILAAFSWLAFWIGLWVKTRFRAVTATLGVLVAWCVVPLILAELLNETTHVSNREVEWVLYLSPAASLAMFEQGEVLRTHGDEFTVCALVFVVYIAVWLVFRALCVRRADRYLGRATPRPEPPVEKLLPFGYPPGRYLPKPPR